MSIEALAMAGLDYQVCGIEFHVWDWEHQELDQPPPYLLADSNSGHEMVEQQQQQQRKQQVFGESMTPIRFGPKPAC
ncbi:hypothetical protein V6N13_089108 [Hibiscus sabdariffa]